MSTNMTADTDFTEVLNVETHNELLNNTKSEQDEYVNNNDADATKSTTKPDSPRQCCSQRWIVAYFGLWLGITTNLFSVNMSVAVVCMVKDVTIEQVDIPYIENATNVSYFNPDTLPYTAEHNSSVHNYLLAVDVSNESVSHNASVIKRYSETGEFLWSKKSQSIILSGYFYGFMLVQIPGGWLGTRFGGRRVIGCCMTLASILTLLIPVLARTSIYLIITARILLGTLIGLTPTNFCGLVGAWALPTERSRMTGLLWFGQMFGAVLAYATSGVLCVNGFDNGWASVFYLHGKFGLLFVGCWWYFVYSCPEQHPRITEAEKSLIAFHNTKTKERIKKPPVPWKKILTYKPLYISYVAHLCDTWTYYLLVTCLPQYLNECLHFDIQSNGFLSCLPFLSFMLGISVSGSIADCIISKNIFTITNIRKLMVIVGFLGIAVFILIPGFLSIEYAALAITCLCICTLFQSIELTGGYSTNAVEIAPRFAAVVFGISNTIASIPGAIVPVIVAVITKNQTVEEWRVVFYIATGVSVFACVIYGLFANNEPAPWADIHENIEIEVDVPKKISGPDTEEINKLI